MARYSKNRKRLTARQRIAALFRVAKISYAAVPSIFYIRIVSAVLDSALPIATTYFAARTTTELALAYGGDEGAGQRAILFVILTAVLGITTTVWSSIQQYISRMATYKLEAAVFDQLISQFLALDYWRYDDKDTADLLDKSRQFSNFFTYMFDTIGTMLTACVAVVTSIVALGLVSWWLSLLMIVAVTPGLLIQYKLSKARIGHWEKNLENRRKSNAVQWQLTELNGIAEIRLYGLVKHLLKLRNTYRDRDEKEQIHIERRFLKYEFLTTVIEAVAEVIALIYVTVRIIAHSLPVGQFLYVQQIVSRGLSGVRQIASSFMRIDEDLANLSAYNEFMEIPTNHSSRQKLKAAPETVTFERVSFTYPQTERPVLQDITLQIKKNENIAIVGENGAGKSTLVKLLLGFYYPTQGEIRIDGTPTKDIHLDSWHRQLGVLQQSSIEFVYATARENVIFGDVSRPFSKERYQKALKNAEATEFLNNLPKKDETYITQWMESSDGTPGVALSGGQKQRLALARNFYRDSPIVILDEPTSAIDALAEARIFRRLFEEKDKTIITISHRLSTVKRADRIYVLENGQIVEEGTHDELVARRGAYYRLFESQL